MLGGWREGGREGRTKMKGWDWRTREGDAKNKGREGMGSNTLPSSRGTDTFCRGDEYKGEVTW